MELTGHIHEDELIAYFCDELGEGRKEAIVSHVDNCPTCEREFRILKTVFNNLPEVLVHGAEGRGASDVRNAVRRKIREQQVYYSRLSIPDTMTVVVAKTHKGLAAILLGEMSRFAFEARLKELFPKHWLLESTEATAPERQQLRSYFNGSSRQFDLELDERLIYSPFQKQVLWALRDVPYGRLVSYGELARRIGNPKSSQAVGQALGRNPMPVVFPCHRVIAGNGKLGGFTGGVNIKRKLLNLEGVTSLESSDQLDLFS